MKPALRVWPDDRQCEDYACFTVSLRGMYHYWQIGVNTIETVTVASELLSPGDD